MISQPVILGMETIVKSIIDLHKSDIDAEMTLVEAYWTTNSDPVALPRPHATAGYKLGQVRVFNSYPTVVVNGRRTTHGRMTSHAKYQSRDEGGGHTIELFWVDRYDDPEVLQKKMYRYVRSSEQILAKNFDLNGTIIMIDTNSVEYSTAVRFSGASVYHQAVQITMTAQTEEAL